MNRQPYSVLAVLLATVVGCTGESGREVTRSADVEVEAIARGYRSLRLITPEAVDVDPQLATLCVGASKQMVDDARERNGPHAHSAVKIYMNDLAADEFASGSTAYAAGSVIVKEKRLLSYRTDSGDWADRGNGVGGMVKREPGFDSENGDWEYFYFDSPDNIESGRIDSCIQCHRQAKQTDFVFGSWHAMEK